jgi:hypothetical protein
LPTNRVQFEYKAPDADERYQPGDELKTKWGDPLSTGSAGRPATRTTGW